MRPTDLFKALFDSEKLMKVVQDMLSSIEGLEDDDSPFVSVEVGGGLVKLSMNQKYDIIDIDIDPSLLREDAKETLEELIVNASKKARKEVQSKLLELMSNNNLYGKILNSIMTNRDNKE